MCCTLDFIGHPQNIMTAKAYASLVYIEPLSSCHQ